MNKNIMDFVYKHLEANKHRLREVSDATGIPYGTLKKIYYRETANPRINTVQALNDYFLEPRNR